jgi:GTP pyrophosphokinase
MDTEASTPADAQTVAALVDGICAHGPDRDLVERAASLAAAAHAGQTRRSGDPYVTHPLEVARIVASWGMDDLTVCAAVLHDVVEDTEVTTAQIHAAFADVDADGVGDGELFADELVRLVEGLTKLDGLKLVSSAGADERQAAGLQKLLLAVAADARVLVAKIADRLHNVRTLEHLPEAKARRIARETMDVYAPLAERLGMAQVQAELDDRCFAVLFPLRRAELERQVRDLIGEREEWLAAAVAELQAGLERAGITAEVSGRAKALWSIYEKMVNKGRTLDQIYDLVGVRIVVDDVAACYAALGVVHGLYAPVPGRFKDLIASPRYNLYQSLHTTVSSRTGAPLEVQLRTREMHARAELGVAAHWRYKSGLPEAAPAWLQRLTQLGEEHDGGHLDAGAYLEHLRAELEGDDVLCFTPRGDVVALPAGATPVDFAYAVHTDIGHACLGARVNGRLVGLSKKLHTGDRVEIITGRDGGPNRDWLGFVTSARARGRIRQWFARNQRDARADAGRAALTRALGERGLPARLVRLDGLDALAGELGHPSAASLLVALGAGSLDAHVVAERLAGPGEPATPNPGVGRTDDVTPSKPAESGEVPVLVQGSRGVPVRLARCCHPVPGEPIVGYVTSSSQRAVSVHTARCPDAARLAGSHPAVEVAWYEGREGVPVAIAVAALDRTGLLSDVARAISEAGGVIRSSSTAVGRDMVSRQRFEVSIADLSALDAVLARIRSVSGVFSAERA